MSEPIPSSSPNTVTAGESDAIRKRIVELERSNRALIETQADIEKLVAYQSRMSLTHTVSELCEIALQAVGELSDNLGSGIYLFDTDDQLQLTNTSDPELHERFTEEAGTFENNNLLDWLYRNMQPIILPSHIDAQQYKTGRTIMLSPLLAGGKRIGAVMTLLRYDEDKIDSRVLKLNTIFANQLGLSLSNAQLVSQVQDYNQRLSEQVNEKTTELQQQNLRLEGAIQELRSLDRMKDNFISTVSHELRTPMTAIRGSVGLILAGAAGPVEEKINDLLQVTHRNTDRLLRLINTLLDLNKIEAGRFELNPEAINLKDLAQNAARDMAHFASGKNVEILAKTDEDIQIMADLDKITQVLHNLLSNAVKFTPEGQVTISVQKGTTTVKIIVTDQGVGISPKNMEKIFNRFYQIDQDMDRGQEGTGLGLSITKALTEAHGGTIQVDSTLG